MGRRSERGWLDIERTCMDACHLMFVRELAIVEQYTWIESILFHYLLVNQ